FSDKASMFGRPLAMLTLMANASTSGASPYSFKLVNLLLHLFTGALMYAVLEALRLHGAPLSRKAAVIVAAIWLVHPWHVSTVLYVVQRMTILASVAQLASILIYLEARRCITSEPMRARLLLFLAFPIVVAAGFL